jgi:hypothetical protein
MGCYLLDSLSDFQILDAGGDIPFLVYVLLIIVYNHWNSIVIYYKVLVTFKNYLIPFMMVLGFKLF